jgi:hypothetical protein
VSDKKKYIVHASIKDSPLYSKAIGSRTELTAYLRQMGVKFRDSELSDIGTDSVYLDAPYGITYEIEEQLEHRRSIVIDNREYIPLSDYCKLTGESSRAVQYAYRKKRIKGLTVGKRNYIYIYKGDVQ